MPSAPPADLIVGPSYVVTQDPNRLILRDAFVATAGTTIIYVGPEAGLPPLAPGGTRIDGSGQFIVPGFIDTHTHLYQTLMKGLGDDMKLLEWLDRLTFPSIQVLKEAHTYFGATIGLAEAIRSGTTTVLDFFVATSRTETWKGISRGYAATGVRGYLGFGLADVSPRRPDALTLDDQLRAIHAYVDTGDMPPLLSPMLGPGVPWSVSPDGFATLRREADRYGWPMTLHIHEIENDEAVCLEMYQTRALHILEDAGWLGPDVVLAHCCYFSEEDVQIAARTGAAVSTNPISNMYLGNKPAPIPEMLAAGVTVSLGADGAASNNTQDMFEALKMVALVHKGSSEDAARITAQQALDIATLGGAKALQMEDRLGSIEAGKLADFFLFDPRSLRSGPWHEPVSTIVYSGGEMNVTATIIDGRVRMQDGVLMGIDERALIAEAQAAADDLREAAGTGKLLAARPYSRVLEAAV